MWDYICCHVYCDIMVHFIFRFAMRDFRKGNGLRYRQNFSVVELLNKDISIKNIKQNFLLKTS